MVNEQSKMILIEKKNERKENKTEVEIEEEK